MFKTWDQLSTVEKLQCEYSDYHKDVYGFRPEVTSMWESEEWLQTQLDNLAKFAQLAWDAERKQEEEAIRAFEEQVQFTIEQGAKSRENALRWIAEACNYLGDWEAVCYEYNLPCNYFTKK